MLDLLDDQFKQESRNGNGRGDFRRWRPRELSAISPSSSPRGRGGSRRNLRLVRSASTSGIEAGREPAEASCGATLRWPHMPLQKEVTDGNTRCRIAKAKPPTCPRSPHVLRTVALGPMIKLEDELQIALSKPSCHRSQRITVSTTDLERCHVDTRKMSGCEEKKEVLGADSFKAAFEKRCRSKTILRDPWKGLPNPEVLRAPSEFDLTINQVWPQSPVAIGLDLDLETVGKAGRAPNKSHWSWRGGADVYIRPCSSTASTRASTRPNSVASTRQSSIDSLSGTASRSSSNGPRRRSRGSREDSRQSSLRRSGFVVDPAVLVAESRLSKAARRRSL